MLSTFNSAVVTVQDKTIAVVSVKPGLFQDSFNASMVIKGLLPVFPGKPVMLMTLDNEGKPAYFGRSDLVLLMEGVDIREAHWQEIQAEVDLTNSCPMKEQEQ